LFHAPGVEGAVADEDCTNALLRTSCEGRSEIAIGPGIYNNELPAQRVRRRLQVCDDDAMTEIVAMKIVERVRTGEIDPERLCIDVLAELDTAPSAT
jgi:hypothetical protein